MRIAILIFVAAALAVSCASSSSTGVSHAACSPLPELVGSWKSYRTSSLGPAWMTVTFNCDCTARVVSQLLFMRHSEVAQYRIEKGVVVFTREGSETRWPFSLEPDALVLREAADEAHRYRRAGAAPVCGRWPSVGRYPGRPPAEPGANDVKRAFAPVSLAVVSAPKTQLTHGPVTPAALCQIEPTASSHPATSLRSVRVP